MIGRVKRAVYVGGVLAAAAVLFFSIVVGMQPGLVDVGLTVTSTTWVLVAVGVGLISTFLMLIAFRARA